MPRTKGIDKLTIGDIQRLLNQRVSELGGLQEKRRSLVDELRGVDRQIRRLGGGLRGRAAAAMVAMGRGSRRSNDRPLREYIMEALARNRKGLRPKDIFLAVREAGHRSDSKRPAMMVHQALGLLIKSGQVLRDDATSTYRLAK